MKIIEPKIKVEDIEIEINDNEESYDDITNVWGRMKPVCKVNEYVLAPSEIRSYEFRINTNSLPTITLNVDDSQFNIRRTLDNDYVDYVTIFIGHKNWYHKITCIITEVYNEANSTDLYIMGTLHVPKLFDTKQASYNNQTVTDILTKICDESDIGLYVIDNPDLNESVKSIQPNIKQIEYINKLISQHTDNIWSIDNFYYLHIGNIDAIKQQEVSKFNFKDGKVLDEPLPIKLISHPNAIDSSLADQNQVEDDVINKYFKIKYYTINTNLGDSMLNSFLEYSTNSETNNQKNIYKQKVNINVGTGVKTNNTFSGFVSHIGKDVNTYESIINKTIQDKLIKITMTEPLYEITPFMNVDIELVLPDTDLKSEERDTIKIDKENSGKRTVFGYTMFFDLNDIENKNPTILQTITLI